MKPAVRAAWLPFNAPLEGVCSWMYLDIKGLVTTGMGNLIDPLSAALPLPWLTTDGGVAESPAISAEWEKVKSTLALAHQGAQSAKTLTTLHLSDAGVNSLVDGALLRTKDILLTFQAFEAFPSWPADAQLGILSMAWAMGPGFGSHFPLFSQAMAAGEFDTAAGNCDIDTMGGKAPLVRRNLLNKRAFQAAATAKDPFQLYSFPAPTGT